MEPSYTKDYNHLEQHVAKLLYKSGWTVITAKQNQVGYNLVIKKRNLVGAVQLKWLRNNVAAPQLLKFADFLDSQEGKKFNFGLFITTKGFSTPALALIRSWGKDAKIYCGIVQEYKLFGIEGIDNEDKSDQEPKIPSEKVYFGIFTCKGGVGKTTIAGHLAGAFALQGFNVALVDLDPEQNLQKLVGDGIFVPNPKGVGTTIEVFNGKDWHEDSARDSRIVICDCSPALERNPIELVKKFQYCIIPTTLNPLGINKHGKVIQETVQQIRQINEHAYLFVLVNNFKDPGKQRLQLLKKIYFDTYKEVSQTDDKFYCIDPEEACIRTSDQLYYWGMHILEDENPSSRLAFELIGGKCYPRDDFINLADYIERKAGFGILKQKEEI
ncbi:AAA family ATPase [Aetokthonos hydrillicola Thurmond2011]|jgi:cellulose biosynthesis protein BcsQ|uniref:AAA family ATPase n=1 Tax=Aetokthonos hydrillicola Thurmond2011 TaxID=2712845 RepID=A0AAP5MCW0_9CYAN|nr:AAA family ATPase [Aetokthonos hydrillicola]MBO3458086.1 AAA family ATPase [Aetokthonos hydrillicola CCALA 1050]MBW4587078.1 AAA family ATPase [Aetokthonos hydrillicola CCALA 1050]MDR9899672.1 AAA family ATPase [Aetokthonos hydrillicola Thurmond2011]